MSGTKVQVVAMAPQLVCENCWQRITRDGGYLAVSMVDIDAVRALERNGPQRNGKVNWRITHEACDTEAKAGDFRIWARQFTNTNDLLLEIAELSDRKVWFSATNWQGLVRRILADTDKYAQTRLRKKGRNGRKEPVWERNGQTITELESENHDGC